MSSQINIIFQWMLEKGMRFYMQMLVPFIPYPYNSRVEMDKEDTDQNKEHMGSEDFSPAVGWTQKHTQPVVRQIVGVEHQMLFSGHVPYTTFDMCFGNYLLIHNERILKECISFWKLSC